MRIITPAVSQEMLSLREKKFICYEHKQAVFKDPDRTSGFFHFLLLVLYQLQFHTASGGARNRLFPGAANHRGRRSQLLGTLSPIPKQQTVLSLFCADRNGNHHIVSSRVLYDNSV